MEPKYLILFSEERKEMEGKNNLKIGNKMEAHKKREGKVNCGERVNGNDKRLTEITGKMGNEMGEP